MKVEDIDIISNLSKEEAETPVKALLKQDRQAQLHANNRVYEVSKNGSDYLVLESGQGYKIVHSIDEEDMEKKCEEKFEEIEEARTYIQNYSNSSL